MRCLECGAEIAERAQVCARCGSWAPVEYQLYVTEDLAADAASGAAGGPAPEAIGTSAGQQHPESESDPELDGAELTEWAGTRTFSTTRLRPGYDENEVDAFLRDIRDTFLGIREPSLTPGGIRKKQFSTTRLRPGYDQEEVDAFLDEAESRLAAQLSARRVAPAAGPGSGAADPAAEPAEDQTGDPIAPLPGESLDQTPGQRPGPASRRNALVMAGLGLVVLVAVTVVVASAVMITRMSPSRPFAPPAPTARSSSSASPVPTDWAGVDQLQSGDCLDGDLGIGNDNSWPDAVAVVPCTQRHIGEVFFAGNSWPESMTYPGDKNVSNKAQARCDAAFFKYDGIVYSYSIFDYEYIPPDNTTWPSGDRFVVCVAYEPRSPGPGAVPMNNSIKGSGQ